VSLHWEGEEADREAARSAKEQKQALLARQVGEPITIANEFSEIRVTRVETRNGSRLLVEAPKSGQWISLDPLALESLTWQGPATFSAMIGHPFGPLVAEDEEQ
jgi:hypothetical protein